MVLNRVVSSSFEHFCNLGPLIFKLTMQQKEDPFLDFGPLASLIPWIQVIVPALSAVLTLPIWQVICDKSPLLWTDFLNEAYKSGILVRCPHCLLCSGISTLRAFWLIVFLVDWLVHNNSWHLVVVDMGVVNSNFIDTGSHAHGVLVALGSVWLLMVLAEWCYLLTAHFFVFIF